MATITTKTVSPFSWDLDRSSLKVGDEITETLKDGREVVFVVMDKGVVGLKDCLGEHYMNAAWTNKGGWLASDMRRYLAEEVFPLLPDELQKVIVPRRFGNEYVALWLFSEMEVFGEHEWTEKDPDRGEQLEYFKDPANRIKRDEDGEPTWWWERSPYASYSSYFCYVNSGGAASIGSAISSWGVCFGFFI